MCLQKKTLILTRKHSSRMRTTRLFTRKGGRFLHGTPSQTPHSQIHPSLHPLSQHPFHGTPFIAHTFMDTPSCHPFSQNRLFHGTPFMEPPYLAHYSQLPFHGTPSGQNIPIVDRMTLSCCNYW